MTLVHSVQKSLRGIINQDCSSVQNSNVLQTWQNSLSAA